MTRREEYLRERAEWAISKADPIIRDLQYFRSRYGRLSFRLYAKFYDGYDLYRLSWEESQSGLGIGRGVIITTRSFQTLCTVVERITQ